MTAEAIVMNRSAVALDADSAVTISGPRASKTFDTANKLFELIKGSNIGVMVYSNMMLNGTPWETIIKAYRNDNSSFSAPYVSDYLEHFLHYMAENSYVLKPDDEDHGAISIAFDGLIPVASMLSRRYAEYVTNKGDVVNTKLHNVLGDICDGWEKHLGHADNLPAAATLKSRTLSTAFKETLKQLVIEVFSKFNLRPSMVNRLTKLTLESLLKKSPNPSDSGLVFAGFGTREYFPSYVSTRVSARLLKHVLHREPNAVEITVDDPGHIETFAQDEPALGWITGISAKTRHNISMHWTQWVQSELPNELQSRVPGTEKLTDEDREKIAAHILQLADNRLNEFFTYMDEYERDEFIVPMFESVAALPKDELGLLAESLVNITSLKQRMSVHQSNTVGGAIDVALISIGDGFVWLNRKHYFEERLNPAWHFTHGARMDTRSGLIGVKNERSE